MICFKRCVTDSFVLLRLWRKQTTAWATCPAPLPTCWPSTWRKAGTWLSGIAVVSPTFPLASFTIHTALLYLWSQFGSELAAYLQCSKSWARVSPPGQVLSSLGTRGRELPSACCSCCLPVQLQSSFLAALSTSTHSGTARNSIWA